LADNLISSNLDSIQAKKEFEIQEKKDAKIQTNKDFEIQEKKDAKICIRYGKNPGSPFESTS
jgi:hypothetical protein